MRFEVVHDGVDQAAAVEEAALDEVSEIAACGKPDGGRLVAPAGAFETGSLILNAPVARFLR